MALRLILQGGSRVKISVHLPTPMVGLRGPLSQNLWNPSPSSSSISCYLHNNTNGSSITKLTSDFLNTQDFTGGTNIYKGAKNDEWIITLAKFAVTKHNENQNGSLKFGRVIGASYSGLSSLLYHITLEGTDTRKEKIYHAVVWLQLWRNFMDLLVWNSVHDALSAVGVKRGDLKLHEAVMLSVNQRKKDLPRL